MPDEGILKAEQRVREMNRMTQQYAERGSRYMQNMMARRNAVPNRAAHPSDSGTRFEPAVPPRENSGQAANPPQIGSVGNDSQIRGGNDRNSSCGKNNLPNGNSRGINTQALHMQNPCGQRNDPPPKPPAPAPPPPIPEPPCEPTHEQKKSAPSIPIPDILSGFGIDSEQLLLIALMYLLIREKADFKLILALGYLIL